MRDKHSVFNKWLVFLISFFTAVCFSAYGNAYVLPGPHILELMTTKSRGVKTLLVSQKLLIYDSHIEKGTVELNETIKYMFPESFRSDIESDNAKGIHVVSEGQAVTVIDGKISNQTETQFDLYKDIILYHSRVLLNEKLTLLGVDVTVTSLGRLDGEILYIVGAQYPDESRPQIWFDRNTFRPMRWLMITETTEGFKDILEVRYLNWQEFRGTWYPMRIEFFKSQQLVREIQVESIRVNPFLSKEIFDIQHIQSMYQPMSVVSPDQDERGGISDIQKTIEEFRKLYE